MSEKKPSPEISPENEMKKRSAEDLPDKCLAEEHGGFKAKGLKEPTRYGDWEVGGRCSDF